MQNQNTYSCSMSEYLMRLSLTDNDVFFHTSNRVNKLNEAHKYESQDSHRVNPWELHLLFSQT